MRFPLTILSCSAFLITGWKILFCISLKFSRLKGPDCVSPQQPKPLRNINPIRLQEENNEFESKRLSQELQWKKWKRSKKFWGEKSKGNSPVMDKWPFRERERALPGPVDPFSILQLRRFFWYKLSRVALKGEWARPIPEPLGTICNEPMASLSFQYHVSRKRWALGTRMGET